MGRKQTPDDLRRRVVELMKAGNTAEETSIETGIGLTTVKANWRKWAEEFGIEVKAPRITVSTVPEDVRRRAVEMRMSGISTVRTAAETGLSDSVVHTHWRKWAEEIGITPPPLKSRERKEQRERGIEAQEKAKKRAVLLKNQGWRTKAVAEETGISVRKIDQCWREWGAEMGIELVKPIEREPAPVDGEVATYYVEPRKK